MKNKLSWISLLVVCCSFGLTLPLAAVNIVSNTTSHVTYPTITEALAALDADGQTLSISPGVYTEPELKFSWAVTLKGSDAATTIIQPAATLESSVSRAAKVWIAAEFNVTLPVVFEGLTLRHGRAAGNGGALFVEEGTVIVRDCVVSQNAATGAGGGLYCTPGSGASLTIEETLFIANSAGGMGGGAMHSICSLCTFDSNTASHGGAVAESVLSGCTISNNSSAQQGGGIYGGSAIRCEVTGNTSLYGGGAAVAALANALVVSNTASQNGGGLYLGSLTNCTVVGNSAATAGGGVFGGVAVNSLFDNNEAAMNSDYDNSALLTYCRAQPLAPGVGNLMALPQFSDAAAGNYRLLPNSLCVDAGLSAAAPLGSDLQGQLRVQGVAVDLGAYEQLPASVVGMPVFTPLSNTFFTEPMLVTITCPTDGAVIRYTLDGSEPTLSSTLYNEPFAVTQSTTVKAIALKDGMVDSVIATAIYVWRARVETPVIGPASGTTFSEPLAVSIICATEGAAIRYTLDGSAPTISSTLYTGVVALVQSTTVMACAFKGGMADSFVATADYARLAKVGAPIIVPVSGVLFTNELEVTISCPTNGASIHYTLDGSDPTIASMNYTVPITLTQSLTLKARAFKAGMVDSEITAATYTRAVTLSDAVGTPALTFTSGGDAPWFVQSNEAHSGLHAVQSGAISHYQSSWTETFVSGAGTLGFWWKVSCEDALNDDWDYVMVAVDGIERMRLDGESGWTEVELELDAGTHTVRWSYIKDRIVSEGSDCAWLDTVVWGPMGSQTQNSPVAVPYAWLDEFNLPVGDDYEVAAMDDADDDGFAAWQEYVAGTCPTNRNSVFLTSICMENDVPIISWIPDMGMDREYTILGKELLSDAAWTTPTNSASRYFRVDISLPFP
ncbi:MAG: chitobiase/beta-hexosaminidase C-terminal domain-containing protein [Kiritimatiellae bacterium]|jgi:parallel beta-helix repeat protein/predicted outer membrane repeat protein|nr:chitobiase/beta-hexosaminidase C-terminal domain-containing protein [Kiritimatiellia bacterium]